MLKKTLTITLATFFLSPLLILTLALSFDATTEAIPELNHKDLIKLKKKLSPNNPFKHQRTGLKNISLDEKAVNQGSQLLLSTYANFPVNIRLHQGHAQITASPALPWLATKLFVNISFTASVKNKQIILDDIYLGLLPIPTTFYNLTYPYIKNLFIEKYPDYYKLISSIRQISFSEKKVTVSYQWDRRFAQRAQLFGKNLLLTDREQMLIAIYYEQLSKIPRLYLRKKTSIHQIIQPLFRFSRQRIAQGENPVEENRAALLTLGIFASGVRINHLIKGKNNKFLRHLRYGKLTLSGRTDLMQHFLISAALTVSTNKALTDSIGLSKEMNDADGGSGFSFADLLADRAGVAFARMATNPSTAILFQEKITDKSLSASDFMPSHKDLPESITALEFKRDYIDIKNKKYLFVEAEISQRINNLPLLSNIPVTL